MTDQRRPALLRALALIVALLSMAAARASDVVWVDPAAARVSLDRAMTLYEDPGGRLDLTDVRATPDADWHAAGRGVDFRSTRSVWWARVRLAAAGELAQSRVLEVASSTIPFVRMYAVGPSGELWRSKVVGASARFDNRLIDYRTPAFPVDLHTGQWVDVYLRFSCKDALFEYVPINLWESGAFHAHTAHEAMLFGLYYGAALGLLLYNLFLFVSTRQSAYGSYVLALATFVLYIATYRGHGLQYLWPGIPDWNGRLLGIACTAVYVTEGLFALEFMGTRAATPGLHRSIVAVMIFALVPTAGFLFDRFGASYVVLGVCCLIGTGILVVTTIARWRQGSRAARYYLIAASALIASGSLAMAAVVGIVPHSEMYQHAVQFGSACEFLLLAFGLADALNVLRAEKLSAERAARQLEAERNEQLFVAKEAAESVSRMKDEILANVSHEMRTPLHAILGFARLGMTRVAPDNLDKARSYFEKIHVGGTRLVHFVENLLELARLNANEVQPHPTCLDPEAIVQRVVQDLQPLLLERRVSVRIDKDPTVASFEADANYLERILLNLTANAMKFSPPGSIITIALARVGPRLGPADQDPADQDPADRTASPRLSQLRITVADQGPGIPPDEIEAIFDPFVQSSRTDQKSGGTGLGLTICRRLVQLQGGTLRARNLPGSGAAFDIELPEAPGIPAPRSRISTCESADADSDVAGTRTRAA